MFPIGTAEANSEQFIIINKSTNKLAFFQNGELEKIYPVGTGKTDDLTPEGTFEIVNKIKNRPYYTDNIPGGDPRNPLGDRWLGLNARGTYGTTYAIHGNNNPSSIGKYVSAGCVRMHNDDVHELFEKVNKYTKVIILKSSRSFEEIAKAHGYSLLPEIEVTINGKKQSYSQAPFIRNGRIFVPMRGIFEELGATVSWKASTRTITATNHNTTLQMTVGSKRMVLNGKEVTIDSAPEIRNGQTFVPVRVVSDALGASITWDQVNRHVTITGKVEPKPETPKEPEPVKAKVIINGKEQEFTQDPIIINGVTMVPMRGVFTSLGATVVWNQAAQTVTARKNDTVIELKVDSTIAKLNGVDIQLDQPLKNINGHTVVPIRFVSEALGARVSWDQATRTVEILE